MTPGTFMASLTVTDDRRASTSASVAIVAGEPAVGPTIVREATDDTGRVGGQATFAVKAAGSGRLHYHWQRDGVDIPNATSRRYTTPPATLADNGAAFQVVVSDRTESVTSRAATLTVRGRAPKPNPISTDTEPSSAPGTLSVSETAATRLTLAWAAATDNVGVVGYRLDAATDEGFASFLPGYQDKPVGNTLSQTVTGLTPATTYYARVRAQDAAGNTSENSPTASGTTLAATPGGLLLPPGWQGYNAMVYDTTDLPLTGHPKVYIAITPANAGLFSKIAVPPDLANGPLVGDLTGDGLVNTLDLVILANYLTGNVQPGVASFIAPLSAADLSGDSLVNAVDLVILQNKLLG